jgi:hypothetical protein
MECGASRRFGSFCMAAKHKASKAARSAALQNVALKTWGTSNTMQMKTVLISMIICSAALVASPARGGATENLPEPKRLNNHTWEILSADKEDISDDKVYMFTTPTDRWLYVGTRVKSYAGRFSISVDEQEEILVFEKGENDTREAMRYLPAGEHTLTINAEGSSKVYYLTVRSIPEILLHNFTDEPAGTFETTHADYLEKYIIPNVNLFVVPGAIVRGEHHLLPLFHTWRSSGRRWISSYAAMGTPDIGGDSYSAEEAYDYITTNVTVTSPLMDGTICDEFTGYDDVSYSNYGEAYRRLRATPPFSEKLFYIYVGSLYGSEHGLSLAKSIIDTGGVLAWERYLTTKATASDAQDHFDDVLISQAQEYREKCPGSIERMAVCFGFFSKPGGHMANLYPGVNYKVHLDMQFHLVANSPVFRDVYGLMGYHSGYADEETLRWMAHLFRHYGIEGRTDRATTDPYVSPHLVNGDFVDGLNGWTVDAAEPDSIVAVTKEGLGYLQSRDGKPQGDTAVRTIRSAGNPNRISQELQDLEPGRLYTFRMMAGDYGDMSKEEEPAVHVTLENVTHLPEKSFTHLFHNPPHRKHPPYDGEETKAWHTYHWHLFRARSDTARVTITDWASDKDSGGPIGQKLVFNYIQVHPYYSEE